MTGLYNVSFESRKHLSNSLEQLPNVERQLDQPEHLFHKLLKQEEVPKTNSVVNLLIPVENPPRKLEKGKKTHSKTASAVFSPFPKQAS